MNAAWGNQLKDLTEIDMPSDPNGFFGRRDYLNITYGKDLTTWLNGSLIAHGRRMIQTAQDTFDQSMKGVELGIKIPGVHWRIADPNMPRVAEVNAGLIPTNIDLNAEATAHGYQPIISAVAGFKGRRTTSYCSSPAWKCRTTSPRPRRSRSPRRSSSGSARERQLRGSPSRERTRCAGVSRATTAGITSATSSPGLRRWA